MGSRYSKTEERAWLIPFGIIPSTSFAFLCFLFISLNTWLFHRGFASKIILYLGEKALIVFHGNPPRLTNLGFSFPPLAPYITLIFRNPFWATGTFGALTAFMLLFKIYQGLRSKRITLPLFVILFLFILASPLSIFLFTEELPACLLIAFLTQMFHHLYRYRRFNVSFDLFVFGILSTFLFFTEFQTIFLIPLLIAALTLNVYFSGDKVRAASIPFVGAFPVVFFALAWCYINWLFLGDPFHFITYWRSALEPLLPTPEGLAASNNLLSALRETLTICFANILLLLPYFLIFLKLLTPRPTKCMVSLAVAITPFLLLVIQVATQQTQIKSYFLLIFLTSAITIWLNNPEETHSHWFNKIFTISFAISLASSFILPTHYATHEEKLFRKALKGSPAFSNLSNYYDLLHHVEKKGMILIDDTRNYPVVFLSKKPKRFFLPFQNEYDTILTEPHLFAHYLILSNTPRMDRVRGRFPLAPFGVISHYIFLGRFGHLLLYEINDPSGLKGWRPHDS